MKKKIIFAASNASHFDNYLETSFFENLKKKYEISFLIFDKERHNDRFQALKQFGDIFFSKYNSKNKFYRIYQRLNLFSYFSNEILKNKKKNIREEKVIERTLCVDKPDKIKLFKILDKLKLLPFLNFVAYNLIRMIDLKHFEKKYSFDLIILMWKIYDDTAFSDSLIRSAKKNNNELLALQINWDAIPSRIALEKPKYLGVIGEQSFQFAFLNYNYSPNTLFPVGMIKLDKYLDNNNLSKVEAKKILNLPTNKKVICFAPSGEEFDEIFILEKLNKLMDKDLYKKNICFYFKGYKGGKKATLENNLKYEYGKKLIDYNNDLKNIIFWEPDEVKLESTEYYKILFNAIDGMISTYSTLALEGAFNKIPSLNLNYFPKKYGLKSGDNWFFQCTWNHLYTWRNHSFVRELEITSREDLESKIELLSKKIISEDADGKKFRDLSLSIVYNINSEIKTIETIDSIIKKIPRDESDQVFISR